MIGYQVDTAVGQRSESTNYHQKMLQQVLRKGGRVPVTPLARHASGANRDWRHKTPVPPYDGWDATVR
jgi:hypothetical protein